MREIKIKDKGFPIILEPYPHILIPSKKQLHGWWPGKRECTGERLLINPYNGCSIGCFFCYTRAFPGYFELFQNRGIVVVAEDFPSTVEKQLDSINVASCGYLSPVCDPFQKVNEKYHYSEKIIRIFTERNIPIEFITKSEVPEEVIELLKIQKHSFGQISILTLDDNLRRVLVPFGADTETLLNNIKRMKKNGIFVVARIDPILPFVNDDKEDLKKLVERCIEAGASHIITSVLDIPLKIKNFVFEEISKKFGKKTVRLYSELYREKIDGYLHADINYRKGIFTFLKSLTQKESVSFALCMEYGIEDGKPRGLNRRFATSINCEGINIPLYIRKNKKFIPATNCHGNCLNCNEALCGISELAMGKPGSKKDWKLKDYRRWSKKIRPSFLSI